MIQHLVNDLHYTSRRELRNLNFFWLGFILYTLNHAIEQTGFLNHTITASFQFFGILLMGLTVINLIKWKIDNQYLKFIYFLYCAWLFIIILRGFHFLLDFDYFKFFLISPFEGMLYFAPLIILFPRNFSFFKKFFDVVIVFGIFYIIYDIIFIKAILNSDLSDYGSQGVVEYFSNLSFSSGFLLLTFSYHSKKRQFLAIVVVVLALLVAIFRARRGLTFMYANMILISFILYFFHSRAKLLILYLTLCIALIGAIYLSGVDKIRDSQLLGNLIERAGEDSRSYVEISFYDDMKTNDWIIGKGLRGKYFCPGVEEDEIYRYTIETGYLQTILKGGLISIGLFLLIAIPALIKGLFYSKNVLSKAASLWIFMSLINSYPGTINAFTLQYLLVWVSIGICYSKEIRNMSDDIIRGTFLSLK